MACVAPGRRARVERNVSLARDAAAALALAVAIASGACAPRATRTASTAAESSIALPELHAPVRIVTDRYGIPHLRAANLDDLYVAWGFITARDRLWQMLWTRAAADGETWRWLGNARLRADGGAQLFELRAHAERAWRGMAGTAAARPLERYAAGVNAYLALCRAGERPWPPEVAALRVTPAKWNPSDGLLLTLAQGVLLDLDLPELDEAAEIAAHGPGWIERRRRFEDQWIYDTIPDSAARRLWPGGFAGRLPSGTMPHAGAAGIPPGLLADARDALSALRAGRGFDPELGASNVFAVGPARSASGAPLLANDPHLALGTPGPFHALHLSVADTVEAIGFAVPGVPAIASGRNRTCAWGVTSVGADVSDLYADTLSADGHRVKFAGAWVPVREAGYRMKFRFLGVPLPPFGQVRRYTPHGPVVVFDPQHRLALSVRWAGLGDSTLRAGLIGIERARTAAEVCTHFRTLGSPALNVIAADRSGDVIYEACGALPRRGFDPGYGPLPDDGAHEWRGLIPDDQHPSWHVPRGGFAVNCNNRPIGPAYPEPLPRYDWVHDRALRIAERLAALPRVTLADLRDIQSDVTSRMARRFTPALLQAIAPLEARLDARGRAALDTLRAWDDRALRADVAPTLLRGWWGALERRSALDGLQGLTLAALEGKAPEALARPGGAAESPAQAAERSLAMALDSLAVLLGPDPARWTWARAHQALFKSPLGANPAAHQPAPVPEDGDNSTPAVAASSLPWRVTVTHGPAIRHLVDLAVEDSSLGIVPPGNSGDPASAHFTDMLARWANHEYVPLYLSWDLIERARESEITLRPAAR